MITPPEFDTVDACFEHYAQSSPHNLLVSHGPRRITYGAARDEVTGLARALWANGVGRGDCVAVYSHPHATTLLLFLACARIGAVFVGIAPRQRADEISNILAVARPTLLIVVGDFEAEHFAKLGTASSLSEHAMMLVGDAGGPWTSLQTLMSRADVSDVALAAARSAVAPDDPVAMVFTSGSSGRPKGALLGNRAMMCSYAVQAAHWYDTVPHGVADLPINHLGFVGDNCGAVLAAGGAVSILERWTPQSVLDLISRDRITFWWTQTTLLLLATRSEYWAGADLSSVRLIGFAGAPLSDELLESLAATGIPLVTGYGMTEVHGNITYTDPGDPLDTVTRTVGRPDPRFDVRIVDDDGVDADVGEPGEIVARGPSLFVGYRDAGGSVVSARDADGYYHTNDVAFRRSDGNFVLVGRKDLMFKSGGFNVYPQEVERVLESHPGVLAAVVVGVPDDTWGHVANAFIVPTEGTGLDAMEVAEYARRFLANYKVPKELTITSSLPMLASGKIDRKSIVEQAQTARKSGQHSHASDACVSAAGT